MGQVTGRVMEVESLTRVQGPSPAGPTKTQPLCIGPQCITFLQLIFIHRILCWLFCNAGRALARSSLFNADFGQCTSHIKR